MCEKTGVIQKKIFWYKLMENVMASVFGQIQLILSFLGGVAKFV